MDFNDRKVAEAHQSKFDEFSYGISIPKIKLIIGWPKSLTEPTMAGTYARFRDAWHTLLSALQSGTIHAFDVTFKGDIKEIAKEKWTTSYFEYNFLSSEIYTQRTLDPENYIISHCYVSKETITEALMEGEEKKNSPGPGKLSINAQLIQKLRVRAREGQILPNVMHEAADLQKWAKDKLVPSNVGSIKNIIEKEHAKLTMHLKKRKNNIMQSSMYNRLK